MPALNDFATTHLAGQDDAEAIQAKVRTDRGLVQYATASKRQPLDATLRDAGRDLANPFRFQPFDDAFPNIVTLRVESLRQMAARLHAVAEEAVDLKEKRHLARQALALAEEAEALARSQ